MRISDWFRRVLFRSLAAERDITTASVSELTRRAGVNRSTFYAHADTPVELLTRVLAAELDDVRRHTMEQLDRDGLLLRDLTRSTMREIVAHVVRHEAVYGSLNRISSVFARSEEHTSELQSLMRISSAVFCLKKKTKRTNRHK